MPHWTSETCAAGGVNIHYWRGQSIDGRGPQRGDAARPPRLRAGQGKPPLLLLHGLTANGACWHPVARHLEGEFDVVMPDARGHGRSSAPAQGYRYEDHAADVLALIAALDLDQPFLLGHSMGGMTAALVAGTATGMAAGLAIGIPAGMAAGMPARRMGAAVRGVVLADPTFLTPRRQREVWESNAAAEHRRQLSRSEGELVAEARRRHPRRSAEILALQCAAKLQTRNRAFEVLEPPNPDYRQWVGAIRAPILLVLADTGGVVSEKTAGELLRLNPRVQTARIAETGHGIPYDQPKRLADAVAQFLRPLARVRRRTRPSAPPGQFCS